MNESAEEMLARFRDTYLKNNQQEIININAVLERERIPEKYVAKLESPEKVEKKPKRGKK